MTMNASLDVVAGARAGMTDDPTRHDGVTMTLHWLTALLVLAQFAVPELWGFAPRPIKHLMIVTHLSLGVVLTSVLALRIFWRLASGRRMARAAMGRITAVSKAMHLALYGLLGTETVLGFPLRWSGHRPISFFGLPIPSPFAPMPISAHRLMGSIHGRIAWAIVLLAAAHALTALFHHFVLRDDVLSRMLPGRRACLPAADQRRPVF
jgi:cytochrome b561